MRNPVLYASLFLYHTQHYTSHSTHYNTHTHTHTHTRARAHTVPHAPAITSSSTVLDRLEDIRCW